MYGGRRYGRYKELESAGHLSYIATMIQDDWIFLHRLYIIMLATGLCPLGQDGLEWSVLVVMISNGRSFFLRWDVPLLLVHRCIRVIWLWGCVTGSRFTGSRFTGLSQGPQHWHFSKELVPIVVVALQCLFIVLQHWLSMSLGCWIQRMCCPMNIATFLPLIPQATPTLILASVRYWTFWWLRRFGAQTGSHCGLNQTHLSDIIFAPIMQAVYRKFS